ncbi:uncharacterized protein LOC110737942 [Chenopodium quinoa]|uniref:uncharacterized protein LOC110737942 n=1 Tax=Chenopodium quinoa TaxID=63459 RepID=UPI000B782D30|nr:uncharacterized protein LOC110737942 [Chenopodium quinoa]
MDDEDEQENEVLNDGYDSEIDEEALIARERVRTCTAKLLQIANQLQREVAKEGYASEYDESEDDLITPPNSGDEEETREERRKRAGNLVSADTDFSVFSWKVGQRFSSREAFRDAVSKYAILQGRNLTYDISNTKVNQRNMERNRKLKSKWVAKQFLEVFKNRPHWPAKEIVETIRRAFKVVVQRGFAYKVKYAAHRMLHGSMHEHYAKLGGYIAALKASSPGSCVELVTVTKLNKQPAPPPVFQRLFTCFEGLKKGWVDGCRKVICVDGCFLKTFLGGQLLSAVGRDGNEQMYPIAWAVEEGENNSSWEWFFEQLKNNLGLGDGEGVFIISDVHMAILNGVKTILPKAEHRHCARHIYALWHKTYKGDELKLMFWKIAKSYNMADYTENLEALEQLDPDAANAFRAYNPKLLCRAFLDTSVKSDAITSNMAETFNGYIINARTKHLIYMLEEIRKRLEIKKNKAVYYDVMPSSEILFNVSYQLDFLVVNLDAKKCTCRKWDMVGISCCHAVACIFFLHKEAEDYVDRSYWKDMYFKAYGGMNFFVVAHNVQ